MAAINFDLSETEYYTPKEIVDRFGPFDYDPATTPELAKHFGIPYYDTKETDGLKADWSPYKRVWINPPFNLKFDFLKKAVAYKDKDIFILLPVSVLTTKTFHQIMNVSYTVYLPNGRIKFRGESPAFGCIIIQIGTKETKIEAFKL